MKPSAKRAFIVIGICAFFTALFAILWSLGFIPLKELEYTAQDWQTRLGRKTPMDDRLVLIGIDKPAYTADFSEDDLQREPVLREMQKTFPWSRAVWARLIEKLGDAGAKVIVCDLVFAAEGDGDQQLKQALEKYKDHVVIGYNISETKTDRGEFIELALPNPSVIQAAGTNSPVEDTRLGYVNIWPDFDGILRRANYRKNGSQVEDILPPETVLESLDGRALREFGRPDLIPNGFDSRVFRYTAPPGSVFGFKVHSIGDVLSPKGWMKNYSSGKFFENKIVLIGPTAQIFQDQHATPFPYPKREMLGPEIHLNIINAALHGEFLDEPSQDLSTIVIVMAGTIAVALCFAFRSPLKRLLVTAVLTAIYWIFAFKVVPNSSARSHIVFVLTPTFVLASSCLVALTYDFFLERREKRRVRKTLERYVSRDVVKELLDNPQTFFNARGGIRRPVTILFSDVRGFTTMTENADGAQLVKQLNEYFEVWVQTVFEHEGSLDKFIGDAVMAVWGNIPAVSRGDKRDAQNAVATALKMKPKLAALNESWKARGWQEFHIGIGINHGDVIVGEIGSSQKAEITAIGDAVNLASRLEGLTKKYHVDLLLGESVAPLVGDYYILRTVASVQPKGKTKAANVYTVIGDGAAQTVSMPVWLARYEEGIQLYRQRQFAEAAAEFKECLSKRPDDFLSARYLEFCQNLIKNPPDDSWTAAEIMTDK